MGLLTYNREQLSAMSIPKLKRIQEAETEKWLVEADPLILEHLAANILLIKEVLDLKLRELPASIF